MYSPIPMKRSMKYGNNYWVSYSPKLQRNVRLFSDLEYDHWVLIETNPEITTFCEQPLRIQQLVQGEIVESVFDIWTLDRKGCQSFIEIKYASELEPNNPKSKRSLRQTEAQKLWCTGHGHMHVIRTDEEIRDNPVHLSNLKQILANVKNRPYAVETDEYIVTQCLLKGRTTLGELIGSIATIPSYRVREAIFRMIYRGELQAALETHLINHQTEVWFHGDEKNL